MVVLNKCYLLIYIFFLIIILTYLGEDTLIQRPIEEAKFKDNRQYNHKIKLQLNEYINVITAKPIFTPILAMTYLFGLFNVFLGTNLVQLNRKLIYSIFNLKKLISKIQDNNLSIKQTDLIKSSNHFIETTNLILEQNIDKNLIIHNLEQSESTKGLKKILNLLKLKIITKLNRTKLKSIFSYDQLIKLNQLICFYILIIYSIYSYADLVERRLANPEISYTDFVPINIPDPISVSFCFDLIDVIDEQINETIFKSIDLDLIENEFRKNRKLTKLNLSRYDNHLLIEEIKENYLNKLYSLYNLEQIDNITNGLIDLIDNIYLSIKQYKFNKTNLTTNHKIHNPFDLKPLIFYFRNMKCFKFFLSKTDYYFTYFIDYSFSSFLFKKNYRFYFIEQGDQLPNRNTTKLYGTIDFRVSKTINKHNCTNFISEFNCETKEDCESLCISNLILTKIKRLNYFYPVQLNNRTKNYYFDNKTISSIVSKQFHDQCSYYPLNTCYRIKYIKYSTIDYESKEILIFLSNEIRLKRNESAFKDVEIINYMINIGSLIYSFNIDTLFNYLIILILLIYTYLYKLIVNLSFLKINSINRLTNLNQSKIKLRLFLKFSKFLIIIIGICWHLKFVLDNYVNNNEYIASNYYDRTTLLTVPNITICIGNKFNIFNETAFHQGKLSNKTAEQLMNEYPSLEDTIEQIEYKNYDLIKVKLNRTEIEELKLKNNFRNEIYLSTFFFLESKCYTFYLSIKYNTLTFQVLNLVYPLKLKFNQFNKSFYYTAFINDKNKYSFKNSFLIEKNKQYHFYYERIRMIYSFDLIFRSYLSNFFQTLSNDVTEFYFEDQQQFFDFILDQFAELNLTTTRLPLINEKYFHLKIDNKAFIKFYRENFSNDENNLIIEQFDSSIYNSLQNQFDSYDSTHIQLNPLFLENFIIYRRRLSLNEIVLYVGSILSFYLNISYIGIIDLIKQFYVSIKYCIKQLITALSDLKIFKLD